MTLRNLIFANDAWNVDTALTLFDNEETQIRTLTVETLLSFFPNYLDCNIEHFNGNDVYLK